MGWTQAEDVEPSGPPPTLIELTQIASPNGFSRTSSANYNPDYSFVEREDSSLRKELGPIQIGWPAPQRTDSNGSQEPLINPNGSQILETKPYAQKNMWLWNSRQAQDEGSRGWGAEGLRVLEQGLRGLATELSPARAYQRMLVLKKTGRAKVAAKPILLTEERREEKLRRAVRNRRPRRVHFRLPKARNVQILKVLEPNSSFILRWLMFMTIPMSYEMWAFPFRLGFADPCRYEAHILIPDLLVDLVFLLDMCVALCTVIPAGTYSDQPEPINSFGGIASTYFRRVFPRMMFPSVAYWLAVILLEGNDATYLKWLWWIATVPRFYVRFDRLRRYFRQMETNLEVSVRTLQLFKFTLIIFMSSHYFGCIFYFLSRLNSFDDTTWVHDFEGLLPLFDKEDSPRVTHYLLCLYKGFNALSNLAYDYGLPKNHIEMIWSLIAMAFQVYLSALILGTLLNYLVTKDPIAEAHKKKMSNLLEYFEQKAIPVELRDRVVKHFQFQYSKNVQNKAAASLTLPKSLEIKAASEKYYWIIERCAGPGKPLNRCSPQFLNALLTKLKVMHVMAGEEVAAKDDTPRELYFLLEGTLHAVDDENRVKMVIRNDLPDMPPMAGGIPFFLGIHHPMTIRSRPDGDVQLLVLSTEDCVELNQLYPEDYEIIVVNLLSQFGLDINGREISTGEEESNGDSDQDKNALKQRIVSSMTQRAEQRFQQLVQACEAGDVESVMLAARKGADVNQKNYDGRTILHMAAGDGNYRMCELLVEYGADHSTRDRWSQTPLEEAIMNRQHLVAGLLSSWKSELHIQNPAAVLCEFASVGDVAQVKKLVENKIDPNIGDYDKRTALHIASAEGQDKVVEFLLQAGADPNVEDRWLGTPLQDAVLAGHILTASLLKAKGGRMPASYGSEQCCTAAGEGDVRKLRLLHDCGESMDTCDYDSRYPLHLAAAEARVLAVSFLLGVSADPNCTDRWGGSPLDDALLGGTLYHKYCAKLIHSWGGELGRLKGTTEGEELMAELSDISISTVRLAIKTLINKGYDKISPQRATEEDLRVAMQASINLMSPIKELSQNVELVAVFLSDMHGGVKSCVSELKETAYKLSVAASIEKSKHAHRNAMGLGTMAPKRTDSAGTFFPEPQSPSSQGFKRTESIGLEFPGSQSPLSSPHSPVSPPRSPPYSQSSPMFGSITRLPSDGRPSDVIAECQELLAAESGDDESCLGSEDSINLDGGMDSDEEMQLYNEIDALLEAQERARAVGASCESFASKSFQRAAMKISDMEDVYDLLIKSCFQIQRGGAPTVVSEEPALTMQEMLALLDFWQAPLGTVHAEEIFEQADEYMWRCGLRVPGRIASPTSPSARTGRGLEAGSFKSSRSQAITAAAQDMEHTVTVGALLAGSSLFRGVLMGMEVDPLLCDVMCTRLGQICTEEQCRRLLFRAEKRRFDPGTVLWDGAEQKKDRWTVILKGEIEVLSMMDNPELSTKSLTSEDKRKFKYLGAGDYFGAQGPVNDTWSYFQLKTIQPCDVLEMPTHALVALAKESPLVKHSILYSTGEASKEVKQEKLGMLGTLKRSLSLKRVASAKTLERRPTLKDAARAVTRKNQLVGAIHNAKSSGPVKIFKLTEENRKKTLNVLNTISDVWQNFAMGSPTVTLGHMHSIQSALGEVSLECYRRIFTDSPELVEVVTESIYWHHWVKFLSAEIVRDPSLRPSQANLGERSIESATAEGADKFGIDQDDDVGLFEKLHARFSPARSLRHRFLEEDVLDRYEPAFITIVGDLQGTLKKEQLPDFLHNIFFEYSYPVSERNCNEFLSTFLKDKPKDTSSIAWQDLRKVLREVRMGVFVEDNEKALMIGTALNPRSDVMRRWKQFIKLCSVYHFIAVPIRASFLPWNSMLDTSALATDLPADFFTFLHVMILFNLAYQNKRSRWVTERSKIMRKANIFACLAAVPVDWFAYLCGASNEACCWLRMNKLCMLWALERSTITTSRSVEMIRKMVYLVATTLHLSSCAWYFVGKSYRLWFPDRDVSWLMVSDELAHLSFDHTAYFGMRDGATTWDQYLLSVYWVSAALTVSGLVGVVIPQNEIELLFTIVLMIFNMTLIRWVLGEVSSIVMSADQDVVKAREELEAVNAFVTGNKFSEELTGEIRTHFRISQLGSQLDQQYVLEGLSHSLRVDLAKCISREFLDRVDLLKGCSERFLDAISVLLVEVHFSPEEYLFRTGETAGEMFCVVSGHVEEILEMSGGAELEGVKREGNSVGGIAFFFGIRHFQSAKASKLEGSTCFRIQREQFIELFKIYPHDEEAIANNAMRSFDQVKSRAASSRRAGSRAGKSDDSQSREGVSNASSGQEGDGVGSGQDDSEDEQSENSDGLDALLGTNMKDKIQALKKRRKKERVSTLLTAAHKGEIQKVQTIFSGDVQVNDQDAYKRTALHVAASEGHLPLVKVLLEMRADITLKDKFGNTAFNDAVRHERDVVAAYLREEIPGIRMTLPGCQAACEMCEAAYQGNLDQIKRLVKNGVLVNCADYDDRASLHLASCEGHVEVVKELIEQNANVECADRFGGTPLADAVRHGHKEVQEVLRAHGASLTAAGADYSVKLCDHAASGDVESIKTLVNNGMDLDLGDYDSRTALHLAACNGKVTVLEYLLNPEVGLNVNVTDRFGGTPCEDAYRHEQTTAVAMLTKAGGLRKDHPDLGRRVIEQQQRVEQLQKQSRKPKIETMTTNSPEYACLEWSRRLSIEKIKEVQLDLQAHVELLNEAINRMTGLLTRRKVVQHTASDPNAQGRLALINGSGAESPGRQAAQESPRAVPEDPHEATKELCAELKVKVFAVKSQLSAAGSTETQKDCKISKMVEKTFKQEVRALKKTLKQLLDLGRVVRRLTKECARINKRTQNNTFLVPSNSSAALV